MNEEQEETPALFLEGGWTYVQLEASEYFCMADLLESVGRHDEDDF